MDKLIDQLLKKAEGYEQVEETTEYVIDEEGNKRAVKEKRQVKKVPPDVTAIKLYLEQKERAIDLSALSDEELEREKVRLLGALIFSRNKD